VFFLLPLGKNGVFLLKSASKHSSRVQSVPLPAALPFRTPFFLRLSKSNTDDDSQAQQATAA